MVKKEYLKAIFLLTDLFHERKKCTHNCVCISFVFWLNSLHRLGWNTSLVPCSVCYCSDLENTLSGLYRANLTYSLQVRSQKNPSHSSWCWSSISKLGAPNPLLNNMAGIGHVQSGKAHDPLGSDSLEESEIALPKFPWNFIAFIVSVQFFFLLPPLH